MWNRRAAERRFSPSDWNGTPTEEVTSYDSSRTNGYNDSQTTLQSGSGAGEMNIDSIYDAIKTKDLTEDNNSGCSEGNLMMDSMRVHVDHHHKSSYVGAYPGHAVKIFTQRRASDPSLTDALTFSYRDSLDAPLSANANIWTRLLRGNDELWDKGDAYNDDDDDSETISEAKCSRLKTCAQLWFYETRQKEGALVLSKKVSAASKITTSSTQSTPGLKSTAANGSSIGGSSSAVKLLEKKKAIAETKEA